MKYLIPILILLAAWVYADDPFAPGGSMLGTALTGVVLDSEINSAANLESKANLGEFASNMLAATSAANARSINGSQQVWITQSLTSNADPYTIVPSAGENIRILLTTHQAAVSLVLSETNAADMKTVVIINVASDAADMADNDTVSELTSPLVLAQHESITFKYHTDRYIEESRATNALSIASLQIQGILSGGARTPVTDAAADFAAAFTGDNLYGGTFVCDTAGTAQLPVMAVGMNFCIVTLGDIAVVVDTNGADGFLKDGITGSEGKNITNKSDAGDIACFQYYDADVWLITTGSETTPFVWTAE